jgi:hypothetical protein
VLRAVARQVAHVAGEGPTGRILDRAHVGALTHFWPRLSPSLTQSRLLGRGQGPRNARASSDERRREYTGASERLRSAAPTAHAPELTRREDDSRGPRPSRAQRRAARPGRGA